MAASSNAPDGMMIHVATSEDCRAIAEIFAIYVKSAFWSAGAGRLFWLEALERIEVEGYKSISLWVFAKNRRAIKFYKRAGFFVEPESGKLSELAGSTFEELHYVRNAG